MIGDEFSPIQMEKSVTNLSSVMQRVFVMMTLGLVVTGVTSLIAVSNIEILQFVISTWLIWAIAEIVLVMFLSLRVEKMGTGTCTLTFFLYAIVNGVTLSTIFLAYTESSIASTFFIAASMFAGAAIIGKTTKKDLTSMGNYLFMALIGLIIAGIVEIFIYNDIFSFIVACIGIAIFIGLTAYDVQKIKAFSEKIDTENEEGMTKLVVMGALTLYLDFINIFLKLLRILGNRRRD